MQPVYYWRKEWDRVLIRPEDWRAIQLRIANDIGEATDDGTKLEIFQFEDRSVAASTPVIEDHVLELKARYRTMRELEITIARVPNGVPLADIQAAPRRDPSIGKKQLSGAGIAPIAASVTAAAKTPALVVEVWSADSLFGGHLIAWLKPHLEQIARKAPTPISSPSPLWH